MATVPPQQRDSVHRGPASPARIGAAAGLGTLTQARELHRKLRAKVYSMNSNTMGEGPAE
jgi:hypothetical protein